MTAPDPKTIEMAGPTSRPWVRWIDHPPPDAAYNCIEVAVPDAPPLTCVTPDCEGGWRWYDGSRWCVLDASDPTLVWRYLGPPVPPAGTGGHGAIIVWSWRDAPGKLQALSTHGGDEDWVALLPDDYAPMWMDEGFGCAFVDRYELGDGSGRWVAIGAHA